MSDLFLLSPDMSDLFAEQFSNLPPFPLNHMKETDLEISRMMNS